jgi:hypothetical protein
MTLVERIGTLRPKRQRTTWGVLPQPAWRIAHLNKTHIQGPSYSNFCRLIVSYVIPQGSCLALPDKGQSQRVVGLLGNRQDIIQQAAAEGKLNVILSRDLNIVCNIMGNSKDTPASSASSAATRQTRQQPGLACNNCRDRKLRCDRQPTCGLCQSLGVECVRASSGLPRGPKKGHMRILQTKISKSEPFHSMLL